MATVLIYCFEATGIAHPLKGNLELVLGVAELFGWLVVYGDGASRMQLYTVGLPFAAVFNGGIVWLLAYLTGRCVKRLTRRNTVT
jgi:hypothetical protein